MVIKKTRRIYCFLPFIFKPPGRVKKKKKRKRRKKEFFFSDHSHAPNDRSPNMSGLVKFVESLKRFGFSKNIV